jgi:hypothetical protein
MKCQKRYRLGYTPSLPVLQWLLGDRVHWQCAYCVLNYFAWNVAVCYNNRTELEDIKFIFFTLRRMCYARSTAKFYPSYNSPFCKKKKSQCTEIWQFSLFLHAVFCNSVVTWRGFWSNVSDLDVISYHLFSLRGSLTGLQNPYGYGNSHICLSAEVKSV